MTRLKASPTIAAAIVLSGLLLVALGFIIPALGCSLSASSKGDVNTTGGDRSQAPMSRPAIPPIDAAAPAEFETATFALG